jgi:GNAT superfamily N-acetyltransferase
MTLDPAANDPDAVAGLIVRRATPDDAAACHDVLWESVTDLGRRQATPLEGSVEDWWRSGESLHRHLAERAAEWWLAEDPGSRRVVGYARSIERDGLVELTEFFVRPGFQSRGLGRDLLERAFPQDDGHGRRRIRSIIATADVRALARYYGVGTVARFPFFTLGGKPSSAELDSRLEPVALARGNAATAAVRDIERNVLGFARGDAEIDWLLGDREGWVYSNEGAIVGFAFVGTAGTGPLAALDPANFPAVLAHVESRAHAQGLDHVEFQVPGPNETAIHHLLGRGYRLDSWINFLMSDRPFGQFDRFIGFGPPIFL